MNNKGFTLVELLATIALLAIIAIISFVSINAVLESSKVNNCENLVDNITSAAKEYVSDNRYKVTISDASKLMDGHNIYTVDGNMYIDLYVSDLITGDYISDSIVDPFSNNEMDAGKISVKVGLNSDYSASSVNVTTDGTEINCENKYTFAYAGGLSDGAYVPGGSSTSDTGTSTSSSGTGSTSGTGSIGSATSTKTVKYINKFPSGASCASGIDEFYTENGVTYYFTCIMSPYIYVQVNGVEYGLVEALESGVVTIAEVEAAKGSKFLSKSLNVSNY